MAKNTGSEFDIHIYEWLDKKIKFLDVTLVSSINEINSQLFLHYSSNHPSSVFKAIVYGQAITVRTICSKDEYVTEHLEVLKQKFIQRGYPIEMVEKELRRGSPLSRMDLLRPKPVYPQQSCPVLQSKPKFIPTFIITYNPHNPQLRKWLEDIHFILLADQKMAEIYPKPPSVTFRQAKNCVRTL